MKKQFLVGSLCVAPVLALAAVPVLGGGPPAPHESVLATVHAVRRNDVSGLLQSLLPADKLAELEQDWNTQRREPIEASEELEFQTTMAMLTAPGAEDQLMAIVEPKLAEMRPQVAMMVGMFSGMAQAAVQQDETLSAEEREKAAEIVNRIGALLLENDITDVGSARRAVGLVCAAARKLELKSLKDIQALSFDQLLGKGDIVLGACKDVFAIYGADVDAWLDSVKAETVNQSGDTALVRVEYEILGLHDSEEVEMVRVDGRWIRKEALELALNER